jgi:threonine aldolase
MTAVTRIDLRSDTVTRPSPAMRRAMAEAECGDAEYDDDPSVRRLEERAAELTGKAGAIYLVTGTMCNQVAMHVMARPGDQVVCAEGAHLANTEVATSALLNGLSFRQVPTRDGIMPPDDVLAALEPDPDRGQVVPLVAVENTFADGGGVPWALDDLRAVRSTAMGAGLPLYLDASRIFNASAATGTPVSDYAAQADALMFCLSKGLGAPIGSVLCGSRDFIEQARATKILFGISWRQAGLTAAAGLVALDESPPLLRADHAHARRLADRIAEVTPAAVDPERVRTNMVFVDPGSLGMTAAALARSLELRGVLVNVVGSRVRFVTHRDISSADVEAAADAWEEIARG